MNAIARGYNYVQESSANRWAVFGDEIAARRKALGRKRGKLLSQREVASAIFITETQLSRIETGVSGTEYETVLALANALEYTGEERRHFFALAGMVESPKSATMGYVISKTGIHATDTGGKMVSIPEEELERLRKIERAAKMMREAFGMVLPENDNEN